MPVSYYAVPTAHFGKQVEVDIGTIQDEEEAAELQEGNGNVAVAVWAPPKPSVVVATDLADLDNIEIEVFNEDEAFRLVAAIELVSPANKDRPAHRRAFVGKCAAYLQKNVSVVIIDVVTERFESLHGELMSFLGLGATVSVITSDLYAIAYRALGRDHGSPRLEMWAKTLQVGAALPTLPLWIAPDRAVPLDLNTSYTATCESLRML